MESSGLADSNTSGRLPPHNLEAERSALGGVLVKPVAFDEMATVADCGRLLACPLTAKSLLP